MLQILGENGCGKTSLLRLLCGLSTPEAGQVYWNGAPVLTSRADYYRDLVYCGHTPAVNGELTALENLGAATALSGRVNAQHASRGMLQRLALQDCGDRPSRLLSAGQRQRVALARVALQPGGLWILDEPTAALDENAIQLLQQILAEQLAVGGMVVFTSHQPLVLDAGSEVAQLHLEQFR